MQSKPLCSSIRNELVCMVFPLIRTPVLFTNRSHIHTLHVRKFTAVRMRGNETVWTLPWPS